MGSLSLNKGIRIPLRVNSLRSVDKTPLFNETPNTQKKFLEKIVEICIFVLWKK